MELFVLSSCYVDNDGYGETRTPEIFTTLEAAQKALQKIWDSIDPDALDEPKDNSRIIFKGLGYAYAFFKCGGMSYYEIYRIKGVNKL